MDAILNGLYTAVSWVLVTFHDLLSFTNNNTKNKTQSDGAKSTGQATGQSQSSSKLSPGAITGIVIGSVVGLALISYTILYFVKLKKSNSN